MFARLIKAVPLAAMLFFSPPIARGDEVPSLVVVEKDGTMVETPIPDVKRVDFEALSFSVVARDGGSASYDYANVKKINFDRTSGIMFPQTDVRLAVWPTVTSSSLNVSGTDAEGMIYVFDIKGRLHFSVRATGVVNTIDVSDLASGHYILRTDSSSVRFIKK